MGVQQLQRVDQLAWDLMKFCQGYKPEEIIIYTIKNGEHKEMLLSHLEGKTKSEKIATLAGVIEVGYYDDIDIVLPTYETFMLEDYDY